MINGVINSKLASMDRALAELRSLGALKLADLEVDWKTRRAVERNLQVLVETMIDVCQRVLSLKGQAPAATAAAAVERCAQMGVLSSSETYRKMVQFRNFVVHHYEQVDTAILLDIVNNRLGDFERFRSEILRYGSP